MPQALLMSVEEYLRTSFDPDRDYVDGEVLERNLGERNHSILQGQFLFRFMAQQDNWGIEALPELRVQVAAKRFRVPDVCVLKATDPRDQIVRKPPLICIEILSPDDTVEKLQAKIDDYIDFGVEHIWVVDPNLRRAWTAGPRGLMAVDTGELAVPGTTIRISLSEVFAQLDRRG